MAVTISLNEVLTFIFLVAGITLLVYLVITASNINSILRDIKVTLRKNKDNINNTISSLPGIAFNISAITGELQEGVQTIAATAEIIEKNISNSSGKLNEKTEIAIDGVQIVSEIIRSGTNYLAKRKKLKWSF
jgi:methyl-accepting chemotaxis protein